MQMVFTKMRILIDTGKGTLPSIDDVPEESGGAVPDDSCGNCQEPVEI